MIAMGKTKQQKALIWAVGLATSLTLLTGLVVLVEPLQELDVLLIKSIALDPTAPGWSVTLWITGLGAGSVIIPLMAVISLFLIFTSKARLLIPQWFGFGVARLVTDGLKLLLGRERPIMDDVVYVAAGVSSPSFPSGHTTSAVFIYGLLAILVMKSLWSKPYKQVSITILLSIVVATSFSRVLLGVHFVSDIVAGMLSGGLGLALSLAIIAREESLKN